MTQRSLTIAAVLALASGLALAQNTQPAPKGGAQDRAALEAAFSRADANTDGKLSKEEAARMPAIATKFADLDKDKDGFLSVEEFSSGYTAAN